MSGRQDEYLSAMGLTRWVRREAPHSIEAHAQPAVPSHDEPLAKVTSPGAAVTEELVSAAVEFGPGQSACLLLCASSIDVSHPLSTDLARCLREPPVWAWPMTDKGRQGSELQTATEERLLSDIVVLGAGLAHLVFGESLPDTCGSARVTVLPGLNRLEESAADRKTCWGQLRASGLVGAA